VLNCAAKVHGTNDIIMILFYVLQQKNT